MDADNVAALYARHSLDAGHFRLVKLLHGEGDYVSELSIGFETHPIDEAPAYTAISHTWGGEAFDCYVLFAGRVRIPVTKSCWDGLRVAVLRARHPLIWIDQLCINQENPDEKSQQIPMIYQIFARASYTAMWIGHCPEYSSSEWRELRGSDETRAHGHDQYDALYGVENDSSKSFVQLQDASRLERTQKMGHGLLLLEQIHYKTMATKPGQVVFSEKQSRHIKLSSSTFAWKAVATILQNRYFQRLWVVQEVMPKGSSYLWLGWLEMPFSILCGAIEADLERFNTPGIVERRRSLQQKAPLSYGCLSAMNHLTAKRALRETSPLLYYLYVCRNFQVSDPRDRFYSLHGLASDHESLPAPNYRSFYSDTWRRHVHHLVHSGDCALLITKAGLWERGSFPPPWLEYDLPSWLPLWFPSSTPSAPILTLHVGDEVDHFWKSYYKFAPGRSSAGGPASFFRSPSLSSNGTRLTLAIHPIDSVAAIELLETRSQASLSRVISTLKDYVNLGLYRRNHYVDTFYFDFCVDEVVYAMKTDIVNEQRRSTIERYMKRPETWRCNHIMVTTSGRLGFVHACAKPGDALVLIPGFGNVMVLREVLSGSVLEAEEQNATGNQIKGVYQVVGDAYLNGVMQGEAMKGKEADLIDVVLV